MYDLIHTDTNVPQLAPQTVELVKSGAVPEANYSLWTGIHTSPAVKGTFLTTYDVVGTNGQDTVQSKFNFVTDLGGCPNGP